MEVLEQRRLDFIAQRSGHLPDSVYIETECLELNYKGGVPTLFLKACDEASFRVPFVFLSCSFFCQHIFPTSSSLKPLKALTHLALYPKPTLSDFEW